MFRLEISRDRSIGKIFLPYSKYIDGILERFSMSESRPAPKPMEEPREYEPTLENCSQQDVNILADVSYRQAIGSLKYLMIGTRPGLAYCAGKLAQFFEWTQ